MRTTKPILATTTGGLAELHMMVVAFCELPEVLAPPPVVEHAPIVVVKGSGVTVLLEVQDGEPE